MNRIRSFVLALVATALVGSGAFAQVAPPAGQPGDAPMTQTEPTTTAVPRDTGTNWGWIGLFGLLGLAGLLRRDTRPVDRTATHEAPRADTTTPRARPR